MVTITKIPGLGDYGVFVDGADLENISIEEWQTVYGKLHLDTLVTIFRGTNLTPDRWSELMLALGRSNSLSPYTFLKKYNLQLDSNLPVHQAFDKIWSELKAGVYPLTPEDQSFVNESDYTRAPVSTGQAQRVSGQRDEQGRRLGIFAEGELLWHSNESGHLAFTPGVGLLAIDHVVGSSTGFSTTARWYQDQSEAFRSELNELICQHEFQPGKINPGLNLVQDHMFKHNFCPTPNQLPLVIDSPGGIAGLHFSPNTVTGFVGMAQEESDALLARLKSELFAENNVYDHWYKTQHGDLLLFDNSITQHRRLGDVKNRLLYRMGTSYRNLTEYQYQPYRQIKFQHRLQQELNDITRVTGQQFKSFKNPVEFTENS